MEMENTQTEKLVFYIDPAATNLGRQRCDIMKTSVHSSTEGVKLIHAILCLNK